MQFRTYNLLLLVLWVAVAMAGFALGGAGHAILLSVFLGIAMLSVSLTAKSWHALEAPQRNLALFAVTIGLLGFLFMLMSLVERASA